jgi:hypothetical protein
MKDFQFKGCWWHSPSILEPMPGPWCGYEIYGMEVVEAWKRILDWHKAHGLDGIITQISSHFKDRTVLGWGFQYVLDFDPHPEARTFSRDFVERNRRRMTRVLEYAYKIGLKMYIHHYNFMAPKNFVQAHSELLTKWKINADRPRLSDMGTQRMICDRIGTIWGNLCWREPVYQAFMKDLWDELFEAFPTLSGVLTTPGKNSIACAPTARGGRKNPKRRKLSQAASKTAKNS